MIPEISTFTDEFQAELLEEVENLWSNKFRELRNSTEKAIEETLDLFQIVICPESPQQQTTQRNNNYGYSSNQHNLNLLHEEEQKQKILLCLPNYAGKQMESLSDMIIRRLLKLMKIREEFIEKLHSFENILEKAKEAETKQQERAACILEKENLRKTRDALRRVDMLVAKSNRPSCFPSEQRISSSSAVKGDLEWEDCEAKAEDLPNSHGVPFRGILDETKQCQVFSWYN